MATSVVPAIYLIVDDLLKNHRDALKRFMLDVDMGLVEVEQTHIKFLPDDASHEDRMAAYAHDWAFASFYAMCLPEPRNLGTPESIKERLDVLVNAYLAEILAGAVSRLDEFD